MVDGGGVAKGVVAQLAPYFRALSRSGPAFTVKARCSETLASGCDECNKFWAVTWFRRT
jgi:hypothetical protein